MPAKIYLSAFKVRIGVEAVQLLPGIDQGIGVGTERCVVGA